MKVAIIDYGSGNLRSVAKAFERAAREGGTNADIAVVSTADDVAGADRIVLPGVGAFGDCKRGLTDIDGLEEALAASVLDQGKPFLGICVGMQLLAKRGFEHGRHDGLGWIDGEVHPITPSDPHLKVPHMGWNEIACGDGHPVLGALPKGAHCYFANSYHMTVGDKTQLLATTDYDGPITAAVGRDNILGLQFHPEKSQAVGQAVLQAFLRWSPS